MLPRASTVLRVREGTLAEVPLPLLLHALIEEERTLTLELRVRQLEKRIHFEDGALVGCRSNLLHETLGKFLVEKGKLTEPEYQKVLGESVQTGRKLGELLVASGKLAPFELYKQLQANLAHQVLDCFRWTDARYRLVAEEREASEVSVKMNGNQLILTGITSVLPFDAVTTHFAFTDERRFAPIPVAQEGAARLKLGARDVRLLQALRQRPTFAELCARTTLELEECLRRLYALVVLGLAGFADEVPEKVQPAPAPAPPPSPEPAPRFLDADEAACNALAQAFLEHRAKDPFALLEVSEDVNPLALRRAFLAKADAFHPARFSTPELRDRAELLLLAFARAYATLAEGELRELWLKRRAAATARKAAPATRSSAEEQFRIRTALLDASAQLDAGRKKLAAGQARAALELFDYACDIEPRPAHLAWRAWARYQVDPPRYAKLALTELEEVLRQEPAQPEALKFADEVRRALVAVR